MRADPEAADIAIGGQAEAVAKVVVIGIAQVLDPHCRFTGIVAAGGAPPVTPLIVLPQPKKSGLFRCPGAAFLRRWISARHPARQRRSRLSGRRLSNHAVQHLRRASRRPNSAACPRSRFVACGYTHDRSNLSRPPENMPALMSRSGVSYSDSGSRSPDFLPEPIAPRETDPIRRRRFPCCARRSAAPVGKSAKESHCRSLPRPGR
jgi:hypothetical protein